MILKGGIMEVIKIKKLTKKYKDITAVDGLNLTINEGELFSLLGENGSGKTTTIKMLSCIVKPTSGDALIDNNSIIDNEINVKKIIGVSLQESAVALNLTVKENLDLICQIHKFSKQKSKEKIDLLSKQFNLEEILNKKAKFLSGGYQRRVSIAMALISEPKILFLDEPTLGLDVIARRKLWDIIKELKGKMTIILTTHYMEEAENLSDRIGILKKGKLLVVGTSKQLMDKTLTVNFENAFISLIKEG